MNPLTNMKNVLKLSENELKYDRKTSWHDMYKDSAWIFVGGLPYDLTEGDLLCIFSQYGEIVNINLIRDKLSGKSKGYCFICYEDQRSTILTVDNLNGIKILNRTIRVDHVANYKMPKIDDTLDDVTMKLRMEGCAPKPQIPAEHIKKEKKSNNGFVDDESDLPQRLPIGKMKTELISEKVKVKKEKKAKKSKKNKKQKKHKKEKKSKKKKHRRSRSSSRSDTETDSTESDSTESDSSTEDIDEQIEKHDRIVPSSSNNLNRKRQSRSRSRSRENKNKQYKSRSSSGSGNIQQRRNRTPDNEVKSRSHNNQYKPYRSRSKSPNNRQTSRNIQYKHKSPDNQYRHGSRDNHSRNSSHVNQYIHRSRDNERRRQS